MSLNRLIPVTAAASAALLCATEPALNLNHSYSRNSLLAEPRAHSGHSFDYRYVGRKALQDSIKVIAIRVEFQADKDLNTTGNGRFGIKQPNDTNFTHKDEKEFKWYSTGGYKYDLLPHDSIFFSQQLDYLSSYYKKVSNNALSISHSIYPTGSYEQNAYQLPRKMALYSPGAKSDNETYADHNQRVVRLLMEFVRDAITVSNEGKTSYGTVGNPFEFVEMDSTTGTLWEVDTTGKRLRKAVVLLIHAGASGLTDRNSDSPSDLIDNFINQDLFEYFSKPANDIFKEKIDTINGKVGMQFTGFKGGKGILSELMMISETSNQDSLNYGTHGILVNQFARQIGIPDLYSTTDGVTGIGRFGIMDFEGYSSANGFIPPYPCAWTRLYMGWDTPILASENSKTTINALGSSNSNTMAIVPLNSHEYWLVENRQRNISGDSALFNYDTVDNEKYIQSENSVNLDAAADTVSDKRKVILSAKSQDVGVAGSGLAVWHIDEALISNRIRYNMINSDPKFRGVALEEADGVVDVGAKYVGYLSTSYGNGTPDDLFPHLMKSRSIGNFSQVRNTMSPTTSPSTHANDGGHSFIEFSFDSTTSALREKYRLGRNTNDKSEYKDFFVYNYVDKEISFSVKPSLNYDIALPNKPLRVSTSSPFDLLTTKLSGTTEQIVILDSLGRLSLVDNGKVLSDSTRYFTTNSSADSSIDTIAYTDSIPGVFTFASVVDQKLLIPTKEGTIHAYSSIVSGAPLSKELISIGKPLSSYITQLDGSEWVVGGERGMLYFGNGSSVQGLSLNDTGAVQAISKSGALLSVVTSSGNLYCLEGKTVSSQIGLQTLVKAPLFAPFTVVSGDLDGDSHIEIAVTDSKQGLFLLQFNPLTQLVKPHPIISFTSFPNDFAGIFHDGKGRKSLHSNGAYPSLTDIDGDGTIEIVVPGTNGIYAFSHRGVLLPKWPIIMDRSNWPMRRSVITSPITVSNPKDSVLTLFATPTGDRLTYEIAKITHTGKDFQNNGKYVAYFTTSDGVADSLVKLDSLNLFDTLLVQNDSLVIPYVMPGGLIDARDIDANRPDTTINSKMVGQKKLSPWPLTVGTPIHSSPVAVNNQTGGINLYAVSDKGYLYNWNIGSGIAKNAIWGMTGGNTGRSFSLSGKALSGEGTPTITEFYSYPNPLRIIDSEGRLTFRYSLGQKANNAKIQIYTPEGRMIYERDIPAERGINEIVLTDLSFIGSAPYTCRLEVTFASGSDIKFVKMAVLRGKK